MHVVANENNGVVASISFAFGAMQLGCVGPALGAVFGQVDGAPNVIMEEEGTEAQVSGQWPFAR